MLHMLLAQNAKTVFCFLQGHRVSLTTVLPDLYGAKLPSNLLLFYELLLFFPPCFSSGSSALVFLLPSLLSSAKDEVKQNSFFLWFSQWFGCFALNHSFDYLREVSRCFCCVHSEPGCEKVEF